jgi:hypothetical protein
MADKKIKHGENCSCLNTYADKMENQKRIKKEIGVSGRTSFMEATEDQIPATSEELQKAFESVLFHNRAYKKEKAIFSKIATDDKERPNSIKGLPVITRIEYLLEALGLNELQNDFSILIGGTYSELHAQENISIMGPKKAKEQGQTKKAKILPLNNDLSKILKDEAVHGKMRFDVIKERLTAKGYDFDGEEIESDDGVIKLSTLKKNISIIRKRLKTN